MVCNPLGKSGGSAIQQAMIIGFGSLAASTPYLGIILLGVVIMWIGAAGSLNKQVCSLLGSCTGHSGRPIMQWPPRLQGRKRQAGISGCFLLLKHVTRQLAHATELRCAELVSAPKTAISSLASTNYFLERDQG